MSDQQTPQRSFPVALVICVLVIAYLGYKLHEEEKRTTPEPQQMLPTFESRIEPIRSEGTDWEAGYYFLVGKRQSISEQTQAQTQAPVVQQTAYQPQKPETEDPILRSLVEQNAAFERQIRDIW